MNTFFSTIINNLNIPEYQVPDPISNDVNDPVLKSILKYKDHPRVKAIEKIAKLNSLFKFSNVETLKMWKIMWKIFETFWKTVKPFLSDKTPSDEMVALIEKDKIIKTGNNS